MVEPSAALPVAAAMTGKLPPGLKSLGIILSGGNIDPSQFADLTNIDSVSTGVASDIPTRQDVR